MARIPIRDDTHWHELREQRIGASEVAALFGCGYQTQFQLWHEKKGDLEHPDYTDNERIVLGRCLEEGIAKAAGELFGYQLKKSLHYYDDDECQRLGATPDYFLVREGSEFPAEIKNASWGSWKDDWIIHEDGFVEAPLRFQLQVQTQLACTGANFALLVALISGDRIVRCEMARHDDAIKEIRQRVNAFWKSIDDNEEPPAEMPRDFEAAKRVWPGGHASVDLRGDPDVEAWLNEIRELREMRKRVDDDKGVIEAKVMRYCVDNKFAAISANGGRISCKQSKAKPLRMVEFQPQPSKLELRITTR